MSADPATLFVAAGVPEPIGRELRQRSYPDGWKRFRVLYHALSGGVMLAVSSLA